MKVLMVTERWFPSVGGGEYHIFHLVRGLLRHGIEVDLVSRDLIGSVTPEGSDGAEGFRVLRLPPRSLFENPVGRALYPPLLIREAPRLGPHDLIHVHCPLGSFPATYLSRRRRVPLVRTLHGVYAGRWKAMLGRTPRAAAYSALEALSLSLRYDAIITVDKQALSLLSGHGGRVLWIPNGVDVEAFNSCESKSSDTFTFLFVGRLVAQKGVDDLLRACSLLQRRGHKFQLLLVGRGPEEEGLRRLTGALGLRNVRFVGSVDEDQLTGLYLSSQALVLPSLWEGLPLTLLEAWAARLPVIATRVGGVPDVALDGRNALLVPPRDPHTLAEAMERVLRDVGLGRRLGVEGRRLVEERFTWNRTVRETRRVYEECMAGRRHS